MTLHRIDLRPSSSGPGAQLTQVFLDVETADDIVDLFIEDRQPVASIRLSVLLSRLHDALKAERCEAMFEYVVRTARSDDGMVKAFQCSRLAPHGGYHRTTELV